MKLTQILLRKKNLKPASFVRAWQWNNQWQLQRERKIRNYGLKEALLERGVVVQDSDDILTPISPQNRETYDIVETEQGVLPQNESHPLWQETPAYSYVHTRRFQPKGRQLDFALALTNTIPVAQLPNRIIETKNEIKDPPKMNTSLQRLIKTCFVGDATQKRLPKDPNVPFIGWHPVESKMRPRNQYDWKAMSWGRNPPRTYGIPTPRRNQNLVRGLFNEVRKTSGISSWSRSYLEADTHRQFINSADGKLLRFYINVNFTLASSVPLSSYADEEQIEKTKLSSPPDVYPQHPASGLWPMNIYRYESNHPITSMENSHPFIHTVVDHDNNNWSIGYPNWLDDNARGRGLLRAFTVALGQARLRFGENITGVLPEPVCLHIIVTNGLKYQLAVLQLNTLDLASDIKNIYWYHDEALSLLESCGYQEAAVVLDGYDPEVFRYLRAIYQQGHK